MTEKEAAVMFEVTSRDIHALHSTVVTLKMCFINKFHLTLTLTVGTSERGDVSSLRGVCAHLPSSEPE